MVRLLVVGGTVCNSVPILGIFHCLSRPIKGLLSPQVYGVSRFGQLFGTQDGGRSWYEHRLPEGARDLYAVACG